MTRSDARHATRIAYHTLAEHVLAPARHRAVGRIGLTPIPGGIGTPPFEDGGVVRQVRLEGVDVVVHEGAAVRRTPITTPAEAAAFVGVPLGAPSDVYTPVTPLAPERPLEVDATAARRLADWFALVAAALDRFATAHAGDDPTPATLWPEHFDLALSMDEVNYGGSPGDDSAPLPYLYVGPWAPRTGEFWTEPYGARLDEHDGLDVDAAVGFFEEGRRRAADDPLS